jgi:retron-type reverse transcriptase
LRKLNRLIAINQLSKKEPTWVHDNIFRILRNEDLWILAYENLKRNKGSSVLGIDINYMMEFVSLKGLDRLKLKVCSEDYIFKRIDITQIPRSNDRTRCIGLSTINDKIVQEVIRLILEAIYEPLFLSFNFGFRKRGCHEALKHVENNFKWVTWVIEKDIEQNFAIIDHYALVKCLSERIKDQRFISLIWKLLRSGVFEYDKQSRSDFGIPQGTPITEILSNIYYHELDEHINKVILNFSSICDSKKRYHEHQIFEHKIVKIYEKVIETSKDNLIKTLLMKEVKNVFLERSKRLRLLDSTVRIEYVRYADDWMIGILGEKVLAEQIKSDITYFIKRHLKQQASFIKTKLTNIKEGNAYFLGYNISLSKECNLLSHVEARVNRIRRVNPILHMDASVKILIKKYTEKGYFLLTKEGVRPISRGLYVGFQDHIIVSHYRRMILQLLNHYSGCTRPGRIQYIQYLLQMSCAMTLGHRHRVSSSKVFHKYGKNLGVKVENTTSIVDIRLKTQWLSSDKIWRIKSIRTSLHTSSSNFFSYSTIGFNCLICDSVGEIKTCHVKHVRKKGFKDFGIHERIALFNRKQVPLCVCCYKRITGFKKPSFKTLLGFVNKVYHD